MYTDRFEKHNRRGDYDKATLEPVATTTYLDRGNVANKVENFFYRKADLKRRGES